MVVAVNVLEKMFPAAAKLGTKAFLELVGAASLGAGFVSFGLDKATEFASNALDGKLEAEKQKLIEKRKAVQKQKEEAMKAETVTEEEETEEKVEEAPKKASNKKNK